MMAQSLFTTLVQALTRSGQTLGAAESLTGGLFSTLVVREAGAGDVFKGSLVTYQTEVKETLLGIRMRPVVSAEVAEEMANRAAEMLGSSIAVGLTGVAGPDTQEGMPVGTVFIGVATEDGETSSRRYLFTGEPDDIRHLSAEAAAQLVLERI